MPQKLPATMDGCAYQRDRGEQIVADWTPTSSMYAKSACTAADLNSDIAALEPHSVGARFSSLLLRDDCA